VGGIFPDPQQPGFKHIILRPNFPGELNDFKAQHQSPYGWIISEWKREGNKLKYKVVIPPNTTATLYLPEGIKGKKVINLKAGTYTYKY
jgi:alpha-L-rhamnosidase